MQHLLGHGLENTFEVVRNGIVVEDALGCDLFIFLGIQNAENMVKHLNPTLLRLKWLGNRQLMRGFAVLPVLSLETLLHKKLVGIHLWFLLFCLLFHFVCPLAMQQFVSNAETREGTIFSMFREKVEVVFRLFRLASLLQIFIGEEGQIPTTFGF